MNNDRPNFLRGPHRQNEFIYGRNGNSVISSMCTVANQEISTKTDRVDSFFTGFEYIDQIGRKDRGGLRFQFLYNKRVNST